MGGTPAQFAAFIKTSNAGAVAGFNATDSDSDGLQDGTEVGVTSGVADPDGRRQRCDLGGAVRGHRRQVHDARPSGRTAYSQARPEGDAFGLPGPYRCIAELRRYPEP